MFPRPRVACITWSSRGGRSEDLARVLGGEAWVLGSKRIEARAPSFLRHLWCAIQTVFYLATKRPEAVLITLPPVHAGVIVALHALVLKVPLILDSHPTAFGAKEHKMSLRLQPLHRWLIKRAICTLVTTYEWVDLVSRWGGRAVIVHEAEPQWNVAPVSLLMANPKMTALFLGIFGGDEPIAELLEAARLTPGVNIRVTGDTRRCKKSLVKNAPSNVAFTGYLKTDQLAREIERANVVIALTTESTSVMRAAYEAVYAQRPLIVSDTKVLRELFPTAVFVKNNARSISSGLKEVLRRYDELCDVAPAALSKQRERWKMQLEELVATIAQGRKSRS